MGLVRPLLAGELVPGNERNVRNADQAGHEPHRAVWSGEEAEIVNVKKHPSGRIDQITGQGGFGNARGLLHEHAIDQLVRAVCRAGFKETEARPSPWRCRESGTAQCGAAKYTPSCRRRSAKDAAEDMT